MPISGSELDYLRTLEDLAERGLPLRTGAVAEMLKVSPPSVTQMLASLERKRLVARVGRGQVRLTAKGRRHARCGVRRHRLIETWLVRCLGMAWSEAHEEAHQLEHAVSSKLEEALARHLGYPERDPHGAAIPDVNGNMKKDDLVALKELAAGSAGQVARLSDRDEEKLGYWSSIGMRLGSDVRKANVAPYGGPVELLVDGEVRMVGAGAMEGVWVRVQEIDHEPI